ncbi:hypothetical protein MK489_02835 [Myxococcota bacterium]|nr:hypothetical protein [Myxococcota bacterium]
MLSKFDDYPIHQTSYPIAQPATSDRHAYDRYWFNGYQDDGEFYIGIGAALYPNLEIMDCGFSIVRDGEQHSFHASRRAPIEPSEIQVGPFQIEILEPMKSLRVTLDDNETGISCQLDWIARTANVQEGHQYSRRGRVPMEATRFNQFGTWSGEVRYDGKSVNIDPARVYGTKDRSWGIRPVGDPAPPGAPSTEAPEIHFLWLPLHWEDRCTHLGMFQNGFGEIWHLDGMVCSVYDSPDDIPGVEDPATRFVTAAEHSLEFVPGTRRARSGEFTLIERGGARHEISVESLLCFRMKGIGYSHPVWGHGKWKGEFAVGGESWKCADVDNLDIENQHIQQVVRARCGDQEGIGVLEQIHMGPHPAYGFKEFLDPA